MKEIQDKISKLEVVVNSKMIPDSVKAKAKAEIEKLKEELKETKVEEKSEKPKKEKKEKAEKKEAKEEPKKAELSEKDCEDLLAKYKAEREARKERAEKREKQGKPAELTPAETAKKAVDRVTDKIDAKAEKGKSVKSDIKAVFSQFKSAVAELKKYKDEIDQDEVRNLIKELESLLTKKMAKGEGVDTIRVGAKLGLLNPKNGRYKYSIIEDIKEEKVFLVEKHPTRSQWDNHWKTTKSNITRFLNEDNEDFKSKKTYVLKYADGGSVGEKEYIVTLQNLETGKLEKFNVLAKNEGKAIDIAYFESGINQPYEFYKIIEKK